MESITRNRLVRHYQHSQSKLLGAGSNSLPLIDVLDAQLIQQAVSDLNLEFRERVFTPVVTLWTFLTQVLSPDRSCRSAVSQLIGWLSSRAQELCSSATGAYVQARQRLPEKLLQHLCLQVAQRLENQTRDQGTWSFRGRPVKMVDGTVLNLPDTEPNQRQYPQPNNQPKDKQWNGFPMVRMLALISFSTGALLDFKLSPYSGKGSGENSLFKSLLQETSALRPGDILLMDRLFCSYEGLAWCLTAGMDCMVRMHASMDPKAMSTQKRFGRGDRLVRLAQTNNSKFAASKADGSSLGNPPAWIVLREVTYRICARGFRPKQIRLLTTLLDPKLYPKSEMAELYWSRWNCELDLRSVKSVMRMGELSCRTPEMIRKEIWVHALGYNLVRTFMAQGAILSQVGPRELSFKGTLQLIQAFRPGLMASRSRAHWHEQYQDLLKAISQQKLCIRPGRTEPRAIKRKRNKYCQLNCSREEARKRFWKKGTAYHSRKAELATIA